MVPNTVSGPFCLVEWLSSAPQSPDAQEGLTQTRKSLQPHIFPFTSKIRNTKLKVKTGVQTLITMLLSLLFNCGFKVVCCHSNVSLYTVWKHEKKYRVKSSQVSPKDIMQAARLPVELVWEILRRNKAGSDQCITLTLNVL